MDNTPVTPTSGTPAPVTPSAQGTSNPPTDQVLTNTSTDPSQGASPASDGAPDDSQGLQPQTSNPNATVPAKTPAPSPATPAQHPAVQRASVLHSIATALAGGPRFKESIDPNTGTISRTQVPLSKGDIGMAIVSEVLSGALSGLSVAPGPGNVGRAAGAGAANAAQQQQQVQQQQTQATAAQGAAFEQNSRAMLNTAQAERLGVESLKDAVAQNATLLSSYTDEGAVDETHVSQDDLNAGMQSGKYKATEQIAVPDGFTNINGKNEQTFAIVKNPSAKVPLTQQMWDDFAAAGVPGYTKGTKIPAGGSMVPGTMIASANHQMQANNQMQQDVASVVDGLNKSGDPAYQELAKSIPDFGKLLSDPQTGPTLQSALGKFQKYISHSDLHGNDLFESLKEMSAPAKPNPLNPKQMIPNGDAAFAKTIAGAFGSGDPQKGWEILKDYHDAVTPDPIKNKDQAESILADPTSTSKAKLQAHNFLTIDANTQAADAAAKQTPAQKEEQSLRITKLQNDIANAKNGGGADGPDYFKNDPALGPLADPSNTSSDGINHKFLDALRTQDPGMANLAYRMATGLDLYSTYGMARPQGEKLGALVSTIAPGFSKGQAEAYFETQKKYSAGGRMGNTISYGNTAFEHLNSLFQKTGALETVGVLRPLGSDTDQQGDFDTVKNQAASEVASFYANGLKPNEKDIADYKAGYSGFPGKVREGIKYQAEKLMDKVQENYNQWRSTVPSSFVPPLPFVSPQGARAYEQLTGQKVNPELMQGAHTIGDNAHPGSQLPVANGKAPGESGTPTAQPSAQPNTPPAGTFPIRRGGDIVGYKAGNGTVTYF